MCSHAHLSIFSFPPPPSTQAIKHVPAGPGQGMLVLQDVLLQLLQEHGQLGAGALDGAAAADGGGGRLCRRRHLEACEEGRVAVAASLCGARRDGGVGERRGGVSDKGLRHKAGGPAWVREGQVYEGTTTTTTC